MSRMSRRWIPVAAVPAAWTPYLLYLIMTLSGHVSPMPAQIEGLVRMVLAIATTTTAIAVLALGHIVHRFERIIREIDMRQVSRPAENETATPAQAIPRLAPAVGAVHHGRAVGRARVDEDLDGSTVVIGQRRRRVRPSRAYPEAPGAVDMYLSDAAEAYELGRQAGLAERDRRPPTE